MSDYHQEMQPTPNRPALVEAREPTRIANPFGESANHAARTGNASADAALHRELAEVQAAVAMAKRFPRDPVRAMERILQACTRTTLANAALYTYARGGSEISGPSIRLAESLAQQWGNIQFGIRELEQRDGESTVEAYAWDLESNVRQSKVFQVGHIRHTKKGAYNLTDPRDIYELVANQGARRLRACILGVIPGDVTEGATAQCEETLRANIQTTPAALKTMVDRFGEFGVSQRQIEALCQCRLEAIRPAQVLRLRKIYTSLRDEMSRPADWFGAPEIAEPAIGQAPGAIAQTHLVSGGQQRPQEAPAEPRRRGRPSNAEREARAASAPLEAQGAARSQPGVPAERGPDEAFGQTVVGPAAGGSPAPSDEEDYGDEPSAPREEFF